MNRIVFLTLILILSSCGEQTVSSGTSSQPEISGPIDPYADPPDYSGNPFENFPGTTGLSIPDEASFEIVEEVLTGTHFTIQISAATSEETALRLAESVSADISHPVFIDHQAGYWKVRVGAFPAREDAVDYLHVLVDMGFSDAWVTTREP